MVPVSDVSTTGRRSWFEAGPRFFLLVWLLLSTAGAAWSVTTPLFASPDEDAHVIKAVAVADGQLAGETVEQPGQYFPIITRVQVPLYYGSARATTACYIWDTRQPASCAPEFEATSTSFAGVETWMGRYPPLYYPVVGLPSRALDGQASALAMRTTSAVLCSALLALGFTALRSARCPGPLMGAGFAAVTPMVLFLAGMVNPTGLAHRWADGPALGRSGGGRGRLIHPPDRLVPPWPPPSTRAPNCPSWPWSAVVSSPG